MSLPAPLQLGATRWDWSRPYLLAVVNVTPDSFSDGGCSFTTEAAVARARALVAEGADALDIGGESTRPGAAPVPELEELARVVPVIRALAGEGVPISIDTTKAAVARAALEAGATLVNDTGLGDPLEALADVAASAGAAYLSMHARGTARTMASLTDYRDVVAEVAEDLAGRAARIERRGVPRERVILDPGVGFAKTADQSLALLADLAPLVALGYAVCVGPSRKSFITAPGGYEPSWGAVSSPPGARLGGTAAAVTACVLQGAHVLRVHDVAVMRQAARVAHVLRLRGGRRA